MANREPRCVAHVVVRLWTADFLGHTEFTVRCGGPCLFQRIGHFRALCIYQRESALCHDHPSHGTFELVSAVWRTLR